MVSLTQIEVTFSEPVLGVNAADLLVDGAAPSGMTNPVTGKYIFTFPAKAAGAVSVQWVGGHGIADSAGNAFAGGAWSYTVDPAALSGGIRINEFVSGNQNGLRDEDGETQDWIELYNPTATPVDLTGWTLSDNESNAEQWVFPARTLGAGQYLVVFCSGKDRRPATGNLHTNFGLSSPSGEFLALYNSQSPRVAVSLFSPAFPEQRNDTSFGVDAQGVWRYYTTPTPGAANGASTISGVTKEVDFSVKRGFFSAPFSLHLSCPTVGASIRYTTDGSAPTATNGLFTLRPIAINYDDLRARRGVHRRQHFVASAHAHLPFPGERAESIDRPGGLSDHVGHRRESGARRLRSRSERDRQPALQRDLRERSAGDSRRCRS